MCGRYIFAEKPENIYNRFKVGKKTKNPLFAQEGKNILPGNLAPVITKKDIFQLEIMRWGLIPYWAKDPKVGSKLINARAETILDKPSFKNCFKNQRCLIPATGFYEWKKEDEQKTPYLFILKSKEIFSFAGIYDIWKDAEGKEIKTFSIITTTPNNKVSEIHDRMPVILKKENEETYLSIESDTDALIQMLNPYKDEYLDFFPVKLKGDSYEKL